MASLRSLLVLGLTLTLGAEGAWGAAKKEKAKVRTRSC